MWCILENICITHVTTCNSSFLIIRSAPAWWLFHRIFKYSRSIEYTRTAHRYIYIYIYIYVYAHTPPTMLTRDRMLGNRPFGHGLPTKIHFIFLSCVFPILFFPSLPHSRVYARDKIHHPPMHRRWLSTACHRFPTDEMRRDRDFFLLLLLLLLLGPQQWSVCVCPSSNLTDPICFYVCAAPQQRFRRGNNNNICRFLSTKIQDDRLRFTIHLTIGHCL